MVVEQEVQKHSVHTLVFRSLKRTHDMFLSEQGKLPVDDEQSEKIKLSTKIKAEFGPILHEHVPSKKEQRQATKPGAPLALNPYGVPLQSTPKLVSAGDTYSSNVQSAVTETNAATEKSSKALVSVGNEKMLIPKKAPTIPKPQWHAPWKLYRVISGHTGWVRCVTVEPGNQWFATGSADRIIKIFDLATGTLKLSLTGHISAVRGVIVSPRHPFLFSCGEDKQVKCWDLEYNKVIRHYHGHLSACQSIDLHPTIDVLLTTSRDSTCRVWDIRTKSCIHTLAGHSNTVATVKAQAAEPQVITGSHDSTVRLWDLAAGKSKVTLTNHKKSVRAIALHPTQFTMASGSADNIKQWKFPDGNFIQNLSGHNAIINSLTVNPENVLVSGADNGTLYFWDWKTGYNFQRIQSTVQPGSIDSENGIFALTWDQSGSRLLTAEADKTIKIYKEDDTATEDTHPLNWRPGIIKGKRF
ncbi:pleiotropic regulator 1-like [Watersipora subatra]|uniref:pleiotropic regulator 1-like n=1 Tax=Watersipora subatra TaxID=2589382 RepID=UPI00355B1E3E